MIPIRPDRTQTSPDTEEPTGMATVEGHQLVFRRADGTVESIQDVAEMDVDLSKPLSAHVNPNART
jgi:hypothetical protein